MAGTWRGRTIAAPRGDATRPTSDRVREALFSALGARGLDLAGRTVLDLFAGSGALGIEALSRGAARATFVESSGPALAALRANLDRLDARASANVLRADALGVRPAALADAPYALILLDPPYRIETAQVRELLESLVNGGALADDALVAYEHATGAEVQWPPGLVDAGHGRYGTTTVSYAARDARGERAR
ncbi:MAG: 16S rRNA (guanine(966)-N(2))-methyltransferase RsmD [Anaerosomatales bacterium]|nr:16S rRNA (guanine(966)-N(2))-methyltransferase RsmD [Anaerosomatales bacterium]